MRPATLPATGRWVCRSAAAVLAIALHTPSTWAQAAAAPACPDATEINQAELLGLWRAEFEGLPAATLLLQPSVVHAEGLSGRIRREGPADAEQAQLAGDLDDGTFTLEESVDGVHIAANWIGRVTAGSCGREIRGDWTRAQDGASHAFVLRKQPGAR